MGEANQATYWRTCDSCAAPGQCVIDGDAYVCTECMAYHRAAVDAATEAVAVMLPTVPRHHLRDVVAAAVKVCCEFPGEQIT